jgi:hypothetical protein
LFGTWTASESYLRFSQQFLSLSTASGFESATLEKKLQKRFVLILHRPQKGYSHFLPCLLRRIGISATARMRDILAALQRINEVALNHLEVSAVTARCMVKQFYFCSSMRIGQQIVGYFCSIAFHSLSPKGREGPFRFVNLPF